MASKASPTFSTLVILTVIIALSIICAEGLKCPQGEHRGCGGGSLGDPCVENVCNVEKTFGLICPLKCVHGCVCNRGLYRRLTDKKCVPKSECKS
uniref:TIL domain containing protein n=1 Tax=Rhipicephalus zambeziensis TaxID=60191 RepID=A0A224YFK9_9ACAR